MLFSSFTLFLPAAVLSYYPVVKAAVVPHFASSNQLTSETALNLSLLPAETALRDVQAPAPRTLPEFFGKHGPKTLFPLRSEEVV